MTTLTVGSAADLRDRVREASARETPLRIVGGGTWLDAGRPVRSVESVSTVGLSGIVDYVPGDLTLTARAGTSLAELRREAGKHNQWLALDPHGSDEGTLGATIVTASAGPLVTAFGTPRDLVLGIEFVSGTGIIARAGGRVVKNVAGFDLTRLMTGSWGTLAVITEATVRLHACPQVDETIAVSMVDDDAVDRARQLLRRLPFAPYACEVVNATLAQGVVGRSEAVALFRLAGNLESVAAQRTALLELGQPLDVSPDAWAALRAAEPRGGAIVFRLSRRPSEIGAVWSEANSMMSDIPGTMLHATPARGVVRCIVPNTDENVARLIAALALSPQSKRIGERMPEPLWAAAFPGRAVTGVAARLKTAFDPRGVLNPGILGDI